MNDMTQSPVRFGPGSSLVGMVTNPGGLHPPAGVACLMLNMGANHRVGPRRINVKLAHALAARGMTSLRFDLGGVGDSDGRDADGNLRTRAVRDLQAGMDMLESQLGLRQFVIVGMCSGAEHAMATAAQDPRVVGISLFDGFAFPQRRARWERALRRALAAPAHPSFPGKAKRWLQRHLLRAQATAPLPGFFTEDEPPAVAAAWFATTMKQLVERKVAVQLLYSGSLHVCDHDRDQLGPFKHEPFAQALHYEFMRDVDHTVCTAKGQQLFLRSVGDWVIDRCFGASPERRIQNRAAASVERPAPAALAAQ
jgi:pimeloyl-ACP methyl ester carboxylesterase